MAFLLEALRLLYWLYFKPLRYREHWQEIAPGVKPDASGLVCWRASRSNSALQHFMSISIFQLYLITPILTVLISSLLRFIGLKLSAVGVAVGLAVGISCGVAAGAATGIAAGVAFGVACGVAGGIAEGVRLGIAGSVAKGVVTGILVGVMGGVAVGVARGVAVGVAVGVARIAAVGIVGCIAVGIMGGLAEGVVFGVSGGVVEGVAGGVAGGVAVGIAFVRLPMWMAEQPWLLLLRVLVVLRLLSPARAVRWSPARFDQLIYIPMPGYFGLLMAASDESAVVAETVQMMQTSPGLQGTGLRVMASLVAEQLAKSGSLDDLVRGAQRLPEQPGLVDPSLAPVFAGLRALGEQVLVARAASLVHRRLDALHRASAQVASLRQGVQLNREVLPRLYLPALAQAERLLQDASARTEEEARRHGEVLSPFIAGNSLVPDDHVKIRGREAQLRQLERHLDRGGRSPSLLLMGPGRIGKSSLLRCLPALLGPSYVPVWTDLQGLAETRTSALFQMLAEHIREQSAKARSLAVPALPAAELERDPYLAFRAWMDRLRPVFAERHLLLCLDEFQCLDPMLRAGTLDAAFLGALRHLTQAEGWVTVLFSGRRGLAELAPQWAGAFNQLAQIRLGCLAPEDAHALLTNPTGKPEEFPVTLPAVVTAQLLELAAGHPFLIQALGDSLVQHLNEERRREARPEDVEPIVRACLETYESAFLDWYHECTEAERSLLRPLCLGPQESSLVITEAAVGPLERLLRDQLVIEKEGRLQFRAELVRRFFAARFRATG